MIVSDMATIRVKDGHNQFVDCVVMIGVSQLIRAVDEVRAAIEKYRAYEYDTYTEAIEAAFMAAKIPFTLIQRPWNGNCDCFELSDELWEDMIENLNNVTVTV